MGSRVFDLDALLGGPEPPGGDVFDLDALLGDAAGPRVSISPGDFEAPRFEPTATGAMHEIEGRASTPGAFDADAALASGLYYRNEAGEVAPVAERPVEFLNAPVLDEEAEAIASKLDGEHPHAKFAANTARFLGQMTDPVTLATMGTAGLARALTKAALARAATARAAAGANVAPEAIPAMERLAQLAQGAERAAVAADTGSSVMALPAVAHGTEAIAEGRPGEGLATLALGGLAAAGGRQGARALAAEGPPLSPEAMRQAIEAAQRKRSLEAGRAAESDEIVREAKEAHFRDRRPVFDLDAALAEAPDPTTERAALLERGPVRGRVEQPPTLAEEFERSGAPGVLATREPAAMPRPEPAPDVPPGITVEKGVRPPRDRAAAVRMAALRKAAGLPAERRAADRPREPFREFLGQFERLDEPTKARELERLHAMAYNDALTGLPNRASFMERLNAPDAPPVKMAFDVEGLKWANDNLPGEHGAGDQILKSVARAFRDEGIDGFRVGGDEFAAFALAPEEAGAYLQRVQRRLDDAVIRHVAPDGKVSEYRGIRLWGAHGDSFEAADAALKSVKERAVAAGIRAPRGERPRSLAEVAPEGREVRSGPSAEAEAPLVSRSEVEQSLQGALPALEGKGLTDKGVPLYDEQGRRVGTRGGVSRKLAAGLDLPELSDIPPGRMAKAIRKDADNPTYLRIVEAKLADAEAQAFDHQQRRAADAEVDEVEPAGDADTSFDPDEFEGGPSSTVAGYEKTPTGMQGRLVGTTRPESAPTIRTEGREGEGPLFTQERDASVREDARRQGGLFRDPATDPGQTGAVRVGKGGLFRVRTAAGEGYVTGVNKAGQFEVRYDDGGRATVAPTQAEVIGGAEPLRPAAAGAEPAQAPKPRAVQADPANPANKLIEAVKAAKPIRRAQERLYTRERAVRAAELGRIRQTTKGEAGLRESRKALQGELPKADFEGVRPQLEQPDVDELFTRIADHPDLDHFESFRAQEALLKLLDSGVVPQKNELALLEEVFGPRLTDAITQPGALQRLGRLAAKTVNTPRALLASFDLSAPLRQGLVLTVRHPAKAGRAFGASLRAMTSSKAFKAVEAELKARPNAGLYKDSGLALTTVKGHGRRGREEVFRNNWAEQVPGIKQIIGASERSYTVYLNKLRADVFDQVADAMHRGGKTWDSHPGDFKKLANFVNIATGRGYLPSGTAGEMLNALFFAPRFATARAQLLASPATYHKLPKEVRREAMSSMAATVGAGLAVLSLAKLGGAKVEGDPRSTDSGKIRVGQTRLDVWGGFQPWVRLFAQLAAGERKTISGRVKKLDNSGIFPESRLDVAGRFVRSKLSPFTGLVIDLLDQKDVTGREVRLSKELAESFVPLFLQDAYDAIREHGLAKGSALAAPAALGVGVTTYEERGRPSPR